MKKLFALVLALALVVGALPALAAEEVNVYNWQDYIDEDVLDLFEEETGIRVNYMGFTTNEDMLAMVSVDPTNYDVIFPSDYIIERMLAMDLLEPLNFDNIPNAAHTLEWLKTPDYDPGMVYSVPYMWGTVGVLYNQTMVKEPITSWTALWDPDYQQDVFMLDSYRDSIGVTLKMMGYSMNERDRTVLEAARDKLIEQKKAGIVKAYQVDETKDKMIAGEAAMGVMWSGDAAYSMEYNEDLVYVVPDEGSNIWVDGMCIPKGAKNKTNAEIFINFLCRPDIALMNFEEIWYCTPNQAVVDGLDEETLADPTLFPSEDVIERSEFFHDVGEDVTLYDELWSDVKTAR
jgi:spermidine/putrescine-binding protein